MNERFGTPASLDEYCTKAQLLNYESIRPMFEAFQVNRYEASGIIQWMLNSSWPKLIWQLYGFDLLPNAALYGTRKALQPLQAIYDYGKNEIIVSNTSLQSHDNLNLKVRVFNLDMTEMLNRDILFDLGSDECKVVFSLPHNIDGLTKTYFLDLRITSDSSETLAINQYLLSTTKDEPDWDRTQWYYTPTKRQQDLRQINNLPDVKLNSDLKSENSGDKTGLSVVVENPSELLALSVELMILDAETGHFIAPVYLDDNYFSLLPGEKRTIKGYCYNSDLKGKSLKLKVSGLNLR